MNLLIDDILVLSRVHSAEQVVTDVALKDVLAKVKPDLHLQINESGATLTAPELPVLSGNPKQLFHLFKNLLSNALKFHEAGNQPLMSITFAQVPGSTLSVPAAQSDTTYYKICFEDNGIGFEQKYATKIFHVFQRLHSVHEYPGTGMGLAVCTKIMENHGGFITAESEPGKGAAFCCYFPAGVS